MQVESLTKQEGIYRELLRRIQKGIWSIDQLIPTEQELTLEFGCSRGTVGRALTRLVQAGLIVRKPHEGTRVVRNVAAGPGALPDFDACAFIYPSDQHEGVWRTLHGFQQHAHAGRRRTLTLSAGTDFRKEAEIIGRLGEFNVRGAVLFPVITNPAEMTYYSQMILACPFPVVLVELALPGMGRSAVVVDGLHAGYTMTRHLIQRGSRRIGFFANYAWAPFVRDRYLGYRQALEEAGIAENPAWVALETGMQPDFEKPLDESVRLARAYLDRSSGEIQAVVCSSDFLALGLIQEAKARGLRVPEDLKVTGIDDFALASKAALTTYRVPYEELGGTAFSLLDEQMSGASRTAREVQVRGEIVVRASA